MLAIARDLRWWTRPSLILVALVLSGCLETRQSSSDPLAQVTAGAAPASLVLVGAPPTDVTVNTSYFFEPYADNDGSVVTYSIDGKPDWMSFDASTGMLTGTPTAAQIGTSADITISAKSVNAMGTIGPFKIQVHTPVLNTGSTPNAAPTVSGTPVTSVVANQTYSFAPTVNDPEGAMLAFSVVNRPTWAVFDTATGRLSGTPGTAMVGSYGNILIRVSDGFTTVALPAFSIQVTSLPAASSNVAPGISGSAATSVQAGNAYSFTPSASDANGDSLTFQIQNKPAWAIFNSATGQLYGTPASTDAGSYANIVIRVSDGMLNASLGAFTVTVTAAVTSTASGSALLTWTAPTVNTDGSALTDLAGYHLIYGKDPNNLVNAVNLPGSTLSYQIGGLDTGTWYFTIRAYNSAGVESTQPSAVSKTIT